MRILTALAALIAFACPAFADWDVAAMNRQIDQTNFVVNEGCSGTLIAARQGLILTANHCVDQQYETVTVEEVGPDGEVKERKVRRLRPGTVSQITFDGAEQTSVVTYRTTIVAVDRALDLALVRVNMPLPNNMSARIACVAPVRGEAVYVVGNPAGVLYSSVTKGIVSSVQRTRETIGAFSDSDNNGKDALMQISAGIVGGNSGGAAYNDRGELVGVNVMGSRTNEILGFSVPLASVRTFLEARDLKALFAHCPPARP